MCFKICDPCYLCRWCYTIVSLVILFVVSGYFFKGVYLLEGKSNEEVRLTLSEPSFYEPDGLFWGFGIATVVAVILICWLLYEIISFASKKTAQALCYICCFPCKHCNKGKKRKNKNGYNGSESKNKKRKKSDSYRKVDSDSDNSSSGDTSDNEDSSEMDDIEAFKSRTFSSV